MSNNETFTWEQINTSLTSLGHSPARIVRVMQKLRHVKDNNLVLVGDD